METTKIFVTTLAAAFVLSYLRQEKSSLVLPATALFCIVIFKYILTRFDFKNIFSDSYFADTPYFEYTQPLIKIFGVSLLTETTADICRQAGENAFSSKIELIGKIEMIILCFPLVEKILEIIKNLILF